MFESNYIFQPIILDIHVSNEKKTWLGFIGDYTTQLFEDYNKPL